jgi:hypothetical protein
MIEGGLEEFCVEHFYDPDTTEESSDYEELE